MSTVGKFVGGFLEGGKTVVQRGYGGHYDCELERQKGMDNDKVNSVERYL